MATTVSVSKGVFAFKRTKTKKNDNYLRAKTIDYWTGGESDGERDLTYKNYVKCLKIVTDITDNLQKKIHGRVFEDLVAFIKNAGQNQRCLGAETGGTHLDYQKDIPTACLLTGVNMPDHEAIFGSLIRLVVDKVTPHVARLQSQECSTVRGAVFKMVSQLMKGNDYIDPDMMDEVESGPSVKRTQCTLAVLTSWYKELMSTLDEKCSPTKGKGGKSKRKNIESPKHVLESPRKSLRTQDSMESPRKTMESLRKGFESPRKAYESPRKALESPMKTWESPRKALQSPMKTWESPRKALQSPKKTWESPRKALESPRKTWESPRKALESPRKTWESPRKRPESPRKALLSQMKPAASPSKSLGSLRTVHQSPEKSLKTPPKNMKADENRSPTPKEECQRQSQPLVIILEDVESFPTHVLQDLILICSEHRCNLPFVFVFGVATTPAAVHRSLSQDASACIAMETFQAQPSTHYMNHVIDEVLMSPKVPLHIGGRTFKLLLDIFLYHDLSVKNFSKALQICMLEHFTGSAASFLCCSSPARKKLVKSASPAQLDIIRKLPSFRVYVESRPPKEQAALLLDEKETKDTILDLIQDLEEWYTRFCCLVKIVNVMTSTLPRSPLGRQVREVLATCLSRSLVETEEYQEVHKMLGLIAREELLPLLNNALTLLQEVSEGDEVLEKFYEDIAVMVGRFNSLDQLGEVVEEASNKETPAAIQATDRFQLKEKLKELAMKKTKKPNAYESVRTDLLKLLEDVFKEHLQPPTKRPLHEVFFFDSSSVVKRHLIGMTRAALTTALSNPHHYLQCNCCQLDDPTNIATTLPDVSVAYKLHLECGRLINLYDWLQAFIAVVDPDSDLSGKKIEKKLQARFIQALLELQFLGFVKQTRRKTDHVARLTWGGC